jgi:hypothetical protein
MGRLTCGMQDSTCSAVVSLQGSLIQRWSSVACVSWLDHIMIWQGASCTRLAYHCMLVALLQAGRNISTLLSEAALIYGGSTHACCQCTATAVHFRRLSRSVAGMQDGEHWASMSVGLGSRSYPSIDHPGNNTSGMPAMVALQG